MTSKRALMGNTSLAFFSSLVALVMCCVAMEFYCKQHYPAVAEIQSLTSSVELGWDSTPAYCRLPDNSGNSAVFFIGDSFTHGKLWPGFAQKEARLSGKVFHGYSFGVSGHGTLQAYLKLLKNYDLFTPRLVVLLFFAWNDLRDNSCYPSLYYNSQTIRRPVMHADGDNQRITYTLPAFVAESASFRHFFFKAYCRISDYIMRHCGIDFIARHHVPLALSYTEQQSWEMFYRPSQQNSPYVRQSWAATEASLLLLKRFLDTRGAKLIVLGIDNAFTVDRDVFHACIADPEHFDVSLPLRRLGTILSKHHIAYKNCLPMLQRQADAYGRKQYLGGANNLSAHLSPEGERVIGEITGNAVVEFLSQQE